MEELEGRAVHGGVGGARCEVDGVGSRRLVGKLAGELLSGGSGRSSVRGTLPGAAARGKGSRPPRSTGQSRWMTGAVRWEGRVVGVAAPDRLDRVLPASCRVRRVRDEEELRERSPIDSRRADTIVRYGTSQSPRPYAESAARPRGGGGSQRS